MANGGESSTAVHAGCSVAGTSGGGGRAGSKRKRKTGGVGGEMAVRRFAAFAAGARMEDVVMVGGVHEVSGAKRSMPAVEERVVGQRDGRGERRERREQRRTAEQQQQARRRGDGPEKRPRRDGGDGGTKFGGAGAWGAGGLGDRTGVG